MTNMAESANRPADTKGETSSAKPIASFRYGNVSAAIFCNQRKAGADREFDAYSISLRRVYRGAEGEQAYSTSLHPKDLLFGSYALLKCFEELHGHETKAK